MKQLIFVLAASFALTGCLRGADTTSTGGPDIPAVLPQE